MKKFARIDIDKEGKLFVAELFNTCPVFNSELKIIEITGDSEVVTGQYYNEETNTFGGLPDLTPPPQQTPPQVEGFNDPNIVEPVSS